MPVKYVEPSTINDVDRGQRKLLQELVSEKVFLGYGLSLRQLLRAKVPLSVIDKCVVARGKDEQAEVSKELGERITNILQENSLESLRMEDAFGQQKDCGWYESRAVSFSKDRVREALLKRKMDPDDIAAIIAEATVETPFTALAIRSVKDDVEKEEARDARSHANAAVAGKAASKKR